MPRAIGPFPAEASKRGGRFRLRRTSMDATSAATSQGLGQPKGHARYLPNRTTTGDLPGLSDCSERPQLSADGRAKRLHPGRNALVFSNLSLASDWPCSRNRQAQVTHPRPRWIGSRKHDNAFGAFWIPEVLAESIEGRDPAGVKAGQIPPQPLSAVALTAREPAAGVNPLGRA